MKNKAILIIYNKFIFFVFVEYTIYVLYFYSIFIFIISIISKLLLNIRDQLPFNLNYAFIFNKVVLNKSNKKMKPTTIKKIQIQDCNKILMRKILSKKIKINTKTLNKIKYNYKQIQKLIRCIKKSGLIYSIKVLSFSALNSTYIILNLKINPILKKVRIIEYKKLQIPRKFLKNLFKTQIGIPKNYFVLNESVQKIYLWYKSRGFEWINIEIINEDISNEICLKIFEGKIKQTKILCQTNKALNQKLISQINYLIKEELQILPGYILNRKKIEFGITRLKNLYLIEDFHYTVNNNSEGVMINFKYSLPKNTTAYLYTKNSILEHTKNYNKILKLFVGNNEQSELIYQLISIIKKLNIYYSIIPLQQYLGCKYQSLNIKNYIHSILINFRMAKYFPEIYILFSSPYIKKTVGALTVNIYNKLFKSHLFYPFFAVKKVGHLHYKHISNLILKTYNININLTHNLLKQIYILETIILIKNTYNKIIIHLYDYYYKDIINHGVSLNKNIFLLEKINKIIEVKLIYIQLCMKFNTLYFIDYIKTGKLFKFQSKLFGFIYNQQHNYLNQITFLGQNINFKYIQIFPLFRMIPYLSDNIFLILLEANFYINKKIYWPIFQETREKNDYINLRKFYKNRRPLYSCYLFNIEYYIYQYKYFSIYTFCNYLNYLSSKIRYSILSEMPSYIYAYEIKTGLGVKLNLPIKKIPNISLEYTINNKGKHFFRLCPYSKYND